MSSVAQVLATFTATATVGEVFQTTVAEPHHVGHGVNILNADGQSPIQVNPSNPLVLIIVQLSLILILSRLLSAVLGRFRVPRVVCEIISGILLGPTAFGNIPGFTENIFPEASITYLSLLANLGLVLFLFIIGLDVDFALLKRNLKPSVAVSTAGLVIPFGLGCAVSVGLYNEFISDDVKFTTFMCFIGTSSCITAFPVLARILADLRLFQDPVGLVVLASGVVNDLIGWLLLALSIALASAGEGVVVVYILLCLAGWWLFLWFICRPALNWLARRTGTFNRADGPTQGYVCAVLALVLVSAFFTQIIGVSEIFGGFLVGLVVPRRLAHAFTVKIEDLIICVFIPLYFATSGLNTDLRLLDSGIIWGWTVCVMVVAFMGKFVGSALAARATGFTWRQSGATGSLMSAKGLIELIVLNQGLQVGIISTTVFSIFVLEALVLTIAATPLTLMFYPAHLRATAPGAEADSKDLTGSPPKDQSDFGGFATRAKTRFAIVLDQLENLGGAMVLAHLLAGCGVDSSPASDALLMPNSANVSAPMEPASAADTAVSAPQTATFPATPSTPASSPLALSLLPVRLVEFTERNSAVMRAAASTSVLVARDPLVSLFRTFAGLFSPHARRVTVEQGEYVMTDLEDWADAVARVARDKGTETLLVPWRIGGGGSGDGREDEAGVVESFIPNPFEALFGNVPTTPSASTAPTSPPLAHAHHGTSTSSPGSATSSASLYAAFLRDLFLASPASCNVGVLLDRSASPASPPLAAAAADGSGAVTHLFLPFFGGSDDRAALELALQLVRSGGGGALRATVLVLERAPEPTDEDREEQPDDASTSSSSSSNAAGEKAPAGGGGTSGAESKPAHPGVLRAAGGGPTTTHLGGAGDTHYGSRAGGGGTTHAQHTTGGGGGGGGVQGLASETADEVALAAAETLAAAASSSPGAALRVERVQTAFPLRTMLRRVRAHSPSAGAGAGGRALVLVGRSRLDAPSHRAESLALLEGAPRPGGVAASGEVRRAVGEAASALLLAGGDEYVLVVQSGRTAGKGRRSGEKRMAVARKAVGGGGSAA
ncbi:uncharacterized protein JCM10292_005931 [Rhodotorula paludigena]|uniref:uncharacterized protein n=1 Tax=Rhodotorula paludigena TaxID=86838 RepID=UPI003172A648